MMPDTHTYTHSCPPLIIRVHEHTHTYGARIYSPSRSASITHTHTPIPISTLHCLQGHIFFLHVYRSVSLARMRRYMQLAYLFHQYVKSLLSTDGRIADCTVRHPGVERPFSSFYLWFTKCNRIYRKSELLCNNLWVSWYTAFFSLYIF